MIEIVKDVYVVLLLQESMIYLSYKGFGALHLPGF
jgi:hypothetical protein